LTWRWPYVLVHIPDVFLLTDDAKQIYIELCRNYGIVT